ncbi:MAG: bifunctional diaminohydroxyphosphoribosylaminopyrimidine deaminase/5-amino-6-(5-phosphoribosylamino)uracil reductase RibD [Betaproteobacteria bacterium]|nr:MAG: bifunctional diaminohydroxyphosphoribosylaminopyrimidine deaminase/5-amino-6-(5-phosphoribosylamino)uracil reductase RibD [Betaproteobacteria bacterium]
MFSAIDAAHMQRALDLATLAMNHATPNPRVGCVMVRDGAVLSEGFTQRPGEAHAEAAAIRNARAEGVDLRGATAYVTLEPCNHFGRTPPCSEALIEAGVARVVAAMQDPNPIVGGKGFARLRDAGIEVRVGLLEHAATELNIGFFKRMKTGRPWVRCKVAASLDGRTGLADGQSQWITGDAARLDGHHWRARACAVLTGSGTVKHDDPAMTVRGVETVLPLRQPLRIVFDHLGELNADARVLRGGALVVCGAKAPINLGKDVEVLPLPDGRGKIDLSAALTEIGARGVNELHVEAGARLMGPMVQAGLVDELLVYLAPKLLGRDAREMFSLPEPLKLDLALQFEFHDVLRIGGDVRMILRKG